MSLSTEQLNRRVHVSSKRTVSVSEMNTSDRDAVSSTHADWTDSGFHEPSGTRDHREASSISWTTLAWKSLLCVACGIVFGISLHKAHVSYPDVIRGQMLLKQFTLFKFYLSALATSMFTLSILAMLPPTHRSFMITCNHYFNKLVEKSIMSSIVGGFLMGTGMTLSGSCPVTIFSQLGSLVPNAGFTFLGSLSGVLFYSLLKPAFDSIFKPTIKESSNPWTNSPYFVLALPLVAMFGITVCAFETLLPWDSEVTVSQKDSWYAQDSWPPYVGGILVGLIQLPLVLSLHETLGGSSSLIVMVSHVFIGPLKKLSPFACKYQHGFSHWWQIFYVAGAVLGGYLSAVASGTLGAAHGVSAIHSFIGGMTMNIGARIGGGCTSGHGLSGMGLLSILSFIFFTSTFAGGIFTAFAMHFSKKL